MPGLPCLSDRVDQPAHVAPVHRRSRGRPPARRGPAGPPHRLRARPAGHGPEGVQRPGRAQAPARAPRCRADRRDGPGRARRRSSASARRSTASPGRWPARSRLCARRSRPTTATTRRASGARRPTGGTSRGASCGLPGIGEMKAKSLIAVLGNRFGVRPPGYDAVAPTWPTLGDVDSAEALATYQAGKRAHKAAMRAAEGADGRRVRRALRRRPSSTSPPPGARPARRAGSRSPRSAAG